jgi:hypothetical protein
MIYIFYNGARKHTKRQHETEQATDPQDDCNKEKHMCISGRSEVDCVILPWKLITHFKGLDQLLQQKHANVGQLNNS